MSKSMTKKELIDELADFSEMRKKDVAGVLDRLAEIAFREAKNGFSIPNLCKFKVVRKKESKCRNPATGELMLIGAHDALKVIPLKKAKDAIAPRRDDLVEIIDEEPTAKTGTASSATAAVPTDELVSGEIVFSCDACGAPISASESLVGQKGKCPYCEADLTIPTREQARQKATEAKPSVSEGLGPGAAPIPRGDFFTFVCHVCGQEIEAPVSMIGQEATCPACASLVNVVASMPEPGASSSGDIENAEEIGSDYSVTNTMRIDLSDLGL